MMGWSSKYNDDDEILKLGQVNRVLSNCVSSE